MSAMSEISESILDIPVVDDVIFDAKEFHKDGESFEPALIEDMW